MKINAPRASGKYADRYDDCQTAIEDALVQLVAEAALAGWGMTEVLSAIIDVADDTMLAINAADQSEFEIELVKAIKKKR